MWSGPGHRSDMKPAASLVDVAGLELEPGQAAHRDRRPVAVAGGDLEAGAWRVAGRACSKAVLPQPAGASSTMISTRPAETARSNASSNVRTVRIRSRPTNTRASYPLGRGHHLGAAFWHCR